MVADFNFVDHIGVNVLPDELPVMLDVGIIDAIGIIVHFHFSKNIVIEQYSK